MVAMLRGRQGPKCGRCGRRGMGRQCKSLRRQEKRMIVRQEGKDELVERKKERKRKREKEKERERKRERKKEREREREAKSASPAEG